MASSGEAGILEYIFLICFGIVIYGEVTGAFDQVEVSAEVKEPIREINVIAEKVSTAMPESNFSESKLR